MGTRLQNLLKPLVPYRVRVKIRSLLERDSLDSRHLERVKAVTAEQWRTLGYRSSAYVRSYWDSADDDSRDTIGKRRSTWLADLLPFRHVQSVMELGCGVGRNLYILQQRYPDVVLHGVDISPEGIEHARRYVRGEFVIGDLYNLNAVLGDRAVDLIFTMGVLIHLHPAALPAVIQDLRGRARKYLIFVEQVSDNNEVVKGPASWKPRRRVTGDYIQWSPDLCRLLHGLGLRFEFSEVPLPMQSNGARHLFIVPLRL